MGFFNIRSIITSAIGKDTYVFEFPDIACSNGTLRFSGTGVVLKSSWVESELRNIEQEIRMNDLVKPRYSIKPRDLVKPRDEIKLILKMSMSLAEFTEKERQIIFRDRQRGTAHVTKHEDCTKIMANPGLPDDWSVPGYSVMLSTGMKTIR